MNAPDLTPADPTDLAGAIAYALTFNERGKPLAVETRKNSAVLARWVVRHLDRSGFVVMQKPPREAHSTG